MKKEPSPNEDSSSWTQPNSCVIILFFIIVQSHSWIRTISQDVQRRTMIKRCNFSSFSPLFFITLFFYSSLLRFWIQKQVGTIEVLHKLLHEYFFFTMPTIWIVIKFFHEYLSSLLQIFYKFTYYSTLSRLVLVFQLQKFTWLS
jgi:hypothetical protein